MHKWNKNAIAYINATNPCMNAYCMYKYIYLNCIGKSYIQVVTWGLFSLYVNLNTIQKIYFHLFKCPFRNAQNLVVVQSEILNPEPAMSSVSSPYSVKEMTCMFKWFFFANTLYIALYMAVCKIQVFQYLSSLHIIKDTCVKDCLVGLNL